ncbi:hypothetical protein BJ508DRAFT_313808 [Ascobolus immersus RN42]|uniref:Uncharacterized protein n=1 Tax=Ascobolus immersus RN42 TaxID=1160509 RepID=A0A3N4HMW9_ASCIM|nr:hypothetical protein BJ508DRAFT_313808 [Ascobolus immersus RN42]
MINPVLQSPSSMPRRLTQLPLRNLTTKSRNHFESEQDSSRQTHGPFVHTFTQYNNELLSLREEILKLREQNIELKRENAHLRRMADPAPKINWSYRRAEPELPVKERKQFFASQCCSNMGKTSRKTRFPYQRLGNVALVVWVGGVTFVCYRICRA